jgi:hypothetical protein
MSKHYTPEYDGIEWLKGLDLLTKTPQEYKKSVVKLKKIQERRRSVRKLNDRGDGYPF